MRVLVISSTFPPVKSGGGEYAYHLCRHLAEQGHEMHFPTSQIAGLADLPAVAVYPIMRSWSWSELPRLTSLVNRLKPDVINLHYSGSIYHNQPMITFVPALLKRRLPSARIITLIEYPTPMNLDHLAWTANSVSRVVAHYVGTENLDRGYGAILRDSDRVIVLSATHVAALATHFAAIEEKVVVIPPPPLLNMCKVAPQSARELGRKELNIGADEFLLIYFGYVYPGKGLETLLGACAKLEASGRRVRLIVTGGTNEVILRETRRPNYLAELRALAVELGVAEKVIWTGYYPADSEKPSLYFHSADACVLPFDAGVSLNNSSFSAAAAHGLPIITTRGEIAEPVLESGNHVLFCPPQDQEALAQAITKVISDDALRLRLAEGAKRLADEWLSWKRTVACTIEIFGVSST